MTRAVRLLQGQLPAVKARADAVRQDGSDAAIVILDLTSPLVAGWLLQRIVAASIAHCTGSDELILLHALDRRALVHALRLDGAPVTGPLDSFRACASDLAAGRTAIVAVTQREIAWHRRRGTTWCASRGLA